jgi:iron(III) transport system permease protein
MIVAIALAVAAFLVAFLVVPVASVLYTAFASGSEGFTLGHFASFFQISLMRESFWNSLYVGGDVGGCSPRSSRCRSPTSRALPLPRRALIQTLGVLPLIMPPFVARCDAAPLRALGLGEPAAERRLRLHDPVHGRA